MRVIAEIPHHTFRISIFSYNARFIIKIEWGQLEQIFKLSEMDLSGGVEDIKKMLTDDFLTACMIRFRSMHSDFNEAYKSITHE